MGWLENKIIAMGREKAAELAAERARAIKANPNLVAEEYARAEANLLKSFPNPNGGQAAVMSCPIAKAERRKARKALIEEGEYSQSPKAIAAAERLNRMMDDVERARLAKHVYLDDTDPQMPASLRAVTAPPGFVRASDDDLKKLGLSPSDLAPKGMGMKAVAYKYDPAIWGPEYADRYAIAFRGSTTAEADWVNNMQNGAGYDSEYYRQAQSIGAKVRIANMASRVDAVGHSLGGGLAQAMHSGTRGISPTTTFNSAGVRDDLATRYAMAGAFSEKGINAYRVRGEVLTATQEQGAKSMFVPDAKGTKHDIDPADRTLRNRSLTEAEATTLHGMDEVIEAMEAQKEQDELTLQKTR